MPRLRLKPTYSAVPILCDPCCPFTVAALLLSSLVFGSPGVSGASPTIIPQPQWIEARSGVFTLCPSQPASGAPGRAPTAILADDASRQTAEYLAITLFRPTGYQFPITTWTGTNAVKGAILLTTSNALTSLGAEGYELTVAPDSVLIRAPGQAGLFYGVQSFLQLLPSQILAPLPPAGNVVWIAPCVYIKDYPRFAWRGYMMDVVRHFFTKQEVKQVLDTLALHKLNTFHWHLVDDQGWRIQMLKYPLLTSNSAWRAGIDYNMNPRASTAYGPDGRYGGFYTQSDIREVVAYAQQRHITIVPEIEMPGHSTAALAAYPQFSCSPSFPFNLDVIDYHYDVFSPGTPGTFQFLQDILAEVIGLFPGQYVHTGGDEVSSTIWTTNIADVIQMQGLGINPGSSTAVRQYQAWFSAQIADWLQAHGRTMIGWTEIEYGGILTNAACMDWKSQSSQALAVAKLGQNVVLSENTNAYINNFMTNDLSVEPFYSSASYLSVSTMYNSDVVWPSLAPYSNHILGAQCNLWAECVPSLLNEQFKMFPRVCALAEQTWTSPQLRNYSDFLARLATHYQRLNQMGVNYDRGFVPQIGSWIPADIPVAGATKTWDIPPNVTAAGEIDVSFWYTSGTNGLDISSVSLLENGIALDTDAHAGYTGPGAATSAANQTLTCYILHLPARKLNATYAIQAQIAGHKGTSCSGKVFLPNWN